MSLEIDKSVRCCGQDSAHITRTISAMILHFRSLLTDNRRLQTSHGWRLFKKLLYVHLSIVYRAFIHTWPNLAARVAWMSSVESLQRKGFPATKLVNTPLTPAGIRLRVSFTWDIEPFRTDLFKGASATDKLRFQWVGRFYSELSPHLRSLRYDESVAADGVAPSHWRSLCHSMQETEASHRYDLRI